MDPLFQEIMNSTVVEAMGIQAVEEYPSEACGVLVGRSEHLSAIAFENIQDKLHKIDPDRYTRTSRTAYNMNTMKLARVQEEHELRVIYHTHVECDAYFSDEDQQCAMTPDGSGPILPGVDYVVMSVYDREPRELSLYRYDESSRKFEYVDGVELQK